MSYNKNNPFFKIINNLLQANIVAENDYALAFLDKKPRAPLHLLLVPKGMYTNLTEFLGATTEEQIKFWELLEKIIKEHKLINYKIETNSGREQEVPHFHIHILGYK